ncbi:LCP family protein [Thermosediminibacter litoriperuensis]|uniref:LytR family transcriptional attenuator n=1 Tax=Thermosediminibacter litoriperuensis TaxID=291989 RepID=A0A5S5AYZ5_9FIRM|nr:LCP family protein [Thermosediminibacter litoriperuensis]TYP57584.1 LytR family transcriptional attenuator [Thermosediminibacter litoriperuensis]
MRRVIKYAVFAILFVVLAFGSGFYFTLRSLNNGSDISPRDSSGTDEYLEGRLNILVLGLDAGTIGADEEHNRHRSDTMMVFSVDPKEKKVNVLSIPRDTRVRIPGVGYQKINAATAYGGPELAVKTVKNFLGVPIHHYVTVNYSGFRKIVDAMGGIEINIEKRREYHDNAGGLHIDLQPGLQVLDGEKAEQFVRFRQYPEGDLGRVKAQQKFMEAALKTLLKPSTLLRLPQIVQAVQESVSTDIEPIQMMKLANIARQIQYDNVKMYILPGEGQYIGGVSYFIPYKSEMAKVVKEVFHGENANVKVAVLNGSGYAGIARKVAQKLEEMGFTVVRVANADSFDYDTTTIIYPREKREDAEKIAKVFANARMKEEESPEENLTTIIVGKDAQGD